MERDWLTTEEVAAELGYTVATVRRWCRDGAIEGARQPGGQYRIHRSQFDRVPQRVKVRQLKQLAAKLEAEQGKVEGVRTKLARARQERADLTRELEALEAEVAEAQAERLGTAEGKADKKLDAKLGKLAALREEVRSLGASYDEYPQFMPYDWTDPTGLGGTLDDQRRRVAGWLGKAEVEVEEQRAKGGAAGVGVIGALSEDLLEHRRQVGESANELKAALMSNRQEDAADLDRQLDGIEQALVRLRDNRASNAEDLAELVKEAARERE